YSYRDGERTLTLAKAAYTDDRGEYRLFWLPPGVYYVTAQPSGQSFPGGAFVIMDDANHRTVRVTANGATLNGSRSGIDKLGQADAPLFYPGTADSRSAAPIDLKPGLDISGIDFSLERVRTHTVRGTVIDGITGRPVTTAGVMLVAAQVSMAAPQR